jgi:predicted NBD/HSP70 family sugar kinase
LTADYSNWNNLLGLTMSRVSPSVRGGLRKSDVREANERFIMNLIRQTPGISRTDLVRITGFSSSTMTFIVNRLLRGGLVEEEPTEGSGQLGRRPVGLCLKPEAVVIVGVELRESEALIVSADFHGTILSSRTASRHSDPNVFLGRVHEAIRRTASLYPKERLAGVGVSLAGTIDRATGRILASENQGWFDVEAGRILSQGIDAPFYFENDAKLGALAERWFCEPGERPRDNFIFITTRDGLGTGVMIGGKLLHGSMGQASEFGHTVLFPDGRPCVCGNTGCWEEYASKRAVERDYRERVRNGAGRGVEAIIELARAGDPTASAVLMEAAEALGIGFANLNAAFDPEALVVSDYIASAWDLIGERVWQCVRKRSPNRYLTHFRILRARHGSDSSLMGALALVLSHFFSHLDRPEHGATPVRPASHALSH